VAKREALPMLSGQNVMGFSGVTALFPEIGMTKKQKTKFLSKKQQAIQLSREMSQLNAEFQQKLTDAKYQLEENAE